MLQYLTQLFCGRCSDLPFNHHKISICALISCIILLRFANIFLLGFSNAKSKHPFVRQKCQTYVLYVGLLDTLCAILPLVFIGSNLHFNNFPTVHVFDSFLAISSALMNKDHLRSKRMSSSGLLASLVISLMTFPLYVYIFISLTPHFSNSSAYQQSLAIFCLLRMILSLIFSCTISFLLYNLIDPSDHEPSFRSLSNASSSNNIDMMDLGLQWSQPDDFVQVHQPTQSWEPAEREVEGVEQRIDEGEGEEEEYETYYEYLFITAISPVFEKASQSKFTGVSDMPPLSSDANCHEQINFLSPAIAAHFSGQSSLQPKASHLFFLLFSRYSYEFLLTGFLVLLKSILQFIGPIMLQQLVLSAQHNKPWSKISVQISILFLSRFCCAFLDTHYQLLSQQLSVKISGALKGSLFRKIISLSSTSRLRFTIGNLTNLYTVDVDRIVEVVKDIHNFWSLPLQISVAMLLLYWVVSYAMFAGFGAVLLIMCANNIVAYQSKLLTNKFIPSLSSSLTMTLPPSFPPRRVMENKDLRMKNISEVFGSLLTIKLNAWEDKFFEKIFKSREVELKFIWGVNVITSINIFLLWLAPSIVSVVTIAVYARGLHQDITAAKIFTALSLFRLLQSPLREFPRYIIQLYQSFTSLERLQTVFRMEEKTSQSHSPGWRGQQGQERSPLSGGGEGGNGFGDCCIEVSGCSFHWYAVASAMPSPEEGEVRGREKEKGAKVLSDIHAAGEEEKIPTFTLNLPSLSIHSGELVVVRGTVGQGKSSLCQALLGEMPMAPSSHSLSSSSSSWNSQCLVQGSISYASQLPWIQNTTLRQNILYTSPYDQEKYFRVLHACCLIEDLNSFPYGDLTFIGQKGINLSGGQKSRIALARAVYADHDIFLLDDILAALDSIVGKKVFDRVICGLLRDKLRILVTHKEEIIEHPLVHQVLSLSNGMVHVDRRKTIPASTAPSVSVTPDSRREIGMGKERGSIMSVEYEIPSADYQVLCEIVSTARALHQYLPLPLPPSSGDLETGDTEETPRNYSYEGLASSASGADTAASTSALAMNFQSEEEKESGRVSAKVYAEYAKAAGGYHVIGILVLVQTIWQLLGIGSDVFLTQWSREDPEEQRENLTRNISIYALLAIGSGCIVLIRTLTISYYGYHAGRTLFNSMLSSLLYAPMWWIDKNPSGRILNRFSDDQDSVDSNVPTALGSLFAMIFSVGGGVLTVFVITRSFGLCIVPIALLYFWFMTRFLSAAREIQRYQSISKSPLLSHVSECIEGLYVIRSLGFQSIAHIHKSHETSLNVYLRVSMTVALGSAWFSLRIQLLGSLFILVISLILFIGSSSSNSSSDGSSGSGSGSAFTISSNMIALALSYTLSVSDDFMDFVLFCSWCEQAMISPERILQYIHLIAEGTEANLRLFRAEEDHDEAHEGGHPPLPPPAGTGIAVGTEDENELEENEDDVTVALLGSNTPTPHRNTATPPPPTRSFSQNSWPSHGIIEFHNVYFKYQPMSQEMILSNLSFHTTAHEKIGIVGRTGAGKSSLTMSLFRIAELSSGVIVIDGEDISHLSLHTLRNAITIIPQAPVLFRGSLKSYLDPFQEYSEEHIWRILRKTHVADLIQQMMDPTPSPSSSLGPSPGPSHGPSADPSPAAVAVSRPYSISDYLQFELAENGENFSIGQRQLLVLSRALLKEVKILIMDEATASMDRETDQRIQQILREEFRGATVLTIAHRIETIIDCDRILVLSAGRMLEFDTPANLLKDPLSAFRKLAEEAHVTFPLQQQPEEEEDKQT